MSPLMGRTPMGDMHKLAVELVWGSREAKERLRMRGALLGIPHVEWECPKCHRFGFARPDGGLVELERCWDCSGELTIVRRAA